MTFTGNYCPNCGQKARTGRMHLKAMFLDFLPDIWNLDNRLLRTIVELVCRPGHMVRNYIIDGRRGCYYSPISLLFLLTAIHIALMHIVFGQDTGIHIDPDTQIDADWEWLRIYLEKAAVVARWFSENRAWLSIIMFVLVLFPVKWCFRTTQIGREMNLTEFFYLLVFNHCQTQIFTLLLMPYHYIQGTQPEIGMGFGLFLSVWLMGQFFRISWRQALRRCLLVAVIVFAVPLSIIVIISAFVD